MEYPKVYLAIDNAFASKRWTTPKDWIRIARDSGVCYIEASADNECDPLYTNPLYIKDWIKDVKRIIYLFSVNKFGNWNSRWGWYSRNRRNLWRW